MPVRSVLRFDDATDEVIRRKAGADNDDKAGRLEPRNGDLGIPSPGGFAFGIA